MLTSSEVMANVDTTCQKDTVAELGNDSTRVPPLNFAQN